MLLIGLLIFGLAILACGFVAVAYLIRAFSDRLVGRWWIAAEAIVALGGVLLGGFFCSVVYPYSPTVRIVGFPFLSAVWELSDGRWLDFVGPLTFPAAIGNILAGFVSPHIPFALVARRHVHRSR